MKLTASLVLFHNDPVQFGASIRSFLEGCDGFLYVVDNSAEPLKHQLFSHFRVKYFFAGENLGFGKAHNRAIEFMVGDSDVHLLLNPDVVFRPHVLPELVAFLDAYPQVGALMPKIVYPDGSLQNLCKLLPTPIDLIFRRFISSERIKAIVNRRYEMHGLPQDVPSCVPTLSGCFLLVRSKLLRKLGGFDERFFMYMEDVDLVRRIGDEAMTVYFPKVEVVHDYAKGSYRNRKLLAYHLRSAFLYFSKWGWFFDRVRWSRNRSARRLVESAKGS